MVCFYRAYVTGGVADINGLLERINFVLGVV